MAYNFIATLCLGILAFYLCYSFTAVSPILPDAVFVHFVVATYGVAVGPDFCSARNICITRPQPQTCMTSALVHERDTPNSVDTLCFKNTDSTFRVQ